MTETMEIELVGGPADGSRATVPEHTHIWVVHQAPMSAPEFIATYERPELFEFATLQSHEYAYVKTQRRAYSGCWVFTYTGERSKK